MQLASVILQTTAVLALVGLVYRSIAWSIDSPILRSAIRRSRLRPGTLAGLLAVCVASSWGVLRLGGFEWQLSTGFFAVMFMLLGTSAVLFCSLVLDELRELWLHVARRVRKKLRLSGWKPPRISHDDSPRRCVEQRSCSGRPSSCSSSESFSHPWRPSERRRTGQPR